MSKQEVNLNTLAQAMHVYHDRMHPGLARVKTRGEVNRTTKKLYKQKGTGNARRGDKNTNIMKGGGHGHSKKKTRDAIATAGFTTREIGNTECAKLDGGMSCLSLRFSPK